VLLWMREYDCPWEEWMPLRAEPHKRTSTVYLTYVIQRKELPSLVYRRASLRALRQAMHRLGILYPLRTIQARSPSSTTYGAPQCRDASEKRKQLSTVVAP